MGRRGRPKGRKRKRKNIMIAIDIDRDLHTVSSISGIPQSRIIGESLKEHPLIKKIRKKKKWVR